MALQIKDWRAVSEKRLKDRLNPESDLGGEGKRWRRRWWMENAMHRSDKTASPQGAALDATGDLSSVTRRRDVIGRTNAQRRQPAARNIGARVVRLYGVKRGDRRTDLPENLSAPSGREPAGDGGHNPSSRRAVCERHKYGSVRAAPSNGGGYLAERGGKPRDGPQMRP